VKSSLKGGNLHQSFGVTMRFPNLSRTHLRKAVLSCGARYLKLLRYSLRNRSRLKLSFSRIILQYSNIVTLLPIIPDILISLKIRKCLENQIKSAGIRTATCNSAFHENFENSFMLIFLFNDSRATYRNQVLTQRFKRASRIRSSRMLFRTQLTDWFQRWPSECEGKQSLR
jgi:hypothetical protein